MSTQDYHIIILGGGITGAYLAAKLSNSSFRITLVDQHALLNGQFKPNSYDLRVSAINRYSETCFKEIQAFDAMEKMRVSPYLAVSINETRTQNEFTFRAIDLGEKNLGHIIENSVMSDALYSLLKHKKNITIIENFSAETIEYEEETLCLKSSTGQTLRGQLLVAADGKHSWIRKQAKISTIQKPYHHSAIVAIIETEKPHQQTAYQHFLPHGPLAFLPLRESHLCSIVWTNTENEANQLLALSEEDFNRHLMEAFSGKLGTTQLRSKRAAFKLDFQHAKNYIANRIALIGDAAHTIHPMAGLGLNFGIRDADVLADCLLKAKIQNRDIGKAYTLGQYQRKQRSRNLLSLYGVNFLEWFFCSKSIPLQYIKKPALSLVNNFPFIKHFFAKQALDKK